MEKLSGAHRVGQRIKSDFLLETSLLRLKIHVDLQPLEALGVLLHPHPLIDLVAEDPGPVERLLGVDEVRMLLGGDLNRA